MITGTALCDLLDDPLVKFVPNDSLHHRQMLQVVMGLEECVTREEFHENTANTPDITRKAPSQIENDFGGPIMSRGNNG